VDLRTVGQRHEVVSERVECLVDGELESVRPGARVASRHLRGDPGHERGERGEEAEATAHTAVESQRGHLSSLKAARIATVRSTLALRAAASRTRSSRPGSELRTESAWMASFASS